MEYHTILCDGVDLAGRSKVLSHFNNYTNKNLRNFEIGCRIADNNKDWQYVIKGMKNNNCSKLCEDIRNICNDIRFFNYICFTCRNVDSLTNICRNCKKLCNGFDCLENKRIPTYSEVCEMMENGHGMNMLELLEESFNNLFIK